MIETFKPFSDEEIAAAALMAYTTTSGTRKSISTADILDCLGITRGSRAWENSSRFVSFQKMTAVIQRLGFSRAHCAKARYYLPNDITEVSP